MAYPATPPPSQRLTILAAAAVLHLGLLALLLSVGGLPPLPAKPLAAITTMTMARDRGSARPPPPTLPSRLAQPQRVFRETQVSDQPDASVQDAAGGCAALPLIAKALVADPSALAAVLGAPPETRSVAVTVSCGTRGGRPRPARPARRSHPRDQWSSRAYGRCPIPVSTSRSPGRG